MRDEKHEYRMLLALEGRLHSYDSDVIDLMRRLGYEVRYIFAEAIRVILETKGLHNVQDIPSYVDTKPLQGVCERAAPHYAKTVDRAKETLILLVTQFYQGYASTVLAEVEKRNNSKYYVSGIEVQMIDFSMEVESCFMHFYIDAIPF